jgi:hypothetical protein
VVTVRTPFVMTTALFLINMRWAIVGTMVVVPVGDRLAMTSVAAHCCPAQGTAK